MRSMVQGDNMKIGTFRIPTFRLYPNLIAYTKKIYEKFPNEETKVEYVAQLIGHKSHRSGTFLQRAADLRLYGLIEGKGKIKVSELGKKITYGHESEKIEALEKAIRNIPLWDTLLNNYGPNINSDDFWVVLAKITDVERLEAQKKAKWILNAYMEDVSHLKPIEKSIETSNSNLQKVEASDNNRNDMVNQTVEPNIEPIKEQVDIEEIKFGNIYIRIPKRDAKATTIAKKLLELYEEGVTKETVIAG